MKWFIKCIKNYVNFNGRARRKEYWYFTLFSIIFMLVFAVLDITLFYDNGPVLAISPFSTLFSLFIFLPGLSVMVRRLHDTGRSGKIVMWYYIVVFIWIIALSVAGLSTFVGAMAGSLTAAPIGLIALFGGGLLILMIWCIFFLVWLCQQGTLGDNKYGPDPKLIEE